MADPVIVERRASPETLAWLKAQDSYANATFGTPSVVKKPDLRLVERAS